jgi:hypothetical protein
MKRFGRGLVSEHVVSELPCDSDDGKIVGHGPPFYSEPDSRSVFGRPVFSRANLRGGGRAITAPRCPFPKTYPAQCDIWTSANSTCC